MIHLTHGYIDIFNHELRRDHSKKVKLVTESNDIVFRQYEENRYNSKQLVDTIFQKVLSDIRFKDNVYTDIKFKKSGLKLLSQNKLHGDDLYNEHSLNLTIRPSEDTAHIFIDELNIIAVFFNEVLCTRKQYLGYKSVILQENFCKLINIPQHGIQIALNHCSSYNKFQDILLSSLYEDLHSCMVNTLKKVNLSVWNIELGNTNLDIENIVNDNMKILIA
jgi:hypothetical protein